MWAISLIRLVKRQLVVTSSIALLTPELADIAKNSHAVRENVAVDLENRHLPVR